MTAGSTATPVTGIARIPRIDAICRGTPADMGRQQGEALRDSIAGADRAVDELEAFRLRRPAWIPYGLFRRLAEIRAARFLDRALQGQPAGDRVRGIAAGAGLPLRKLALLNALEPVLSSLADMTEIGPPGGCTAVAVRGSRSATGEPLIIRNFDYLPLVQAFYVMRESRPLNGRRALEFTAAPLAGAVDGVNESGLCITFNYAFATDLPSPAPPISVRISEALSTCTTVAEAAGQLQSRPRWGAGLLMLADGSGDIAALELSNTRSSLRRPAPGEDLIYHSNCFLTDDMRRVQIDERAVYTDRAATMVRGTRPLQSPERRDTRLAELLHGDHVLSSRDLATVMSDHGCDGVPSADTICMHSGYWNTTASLQWYPRSRKVRVAYASACSAEHVELELS
jgi:hypothetical protein